MIAKKGGDYMAEWTIRSSETGAVICTGYTAETGPEAEDLFLEEHPAYEQDEIYAAESQWND